MKPYYEEPGITIFHGDCRDVLPAFQHRFYEHIKIDLVMMDPPYGIGEVGNNQRFQRRNKSRGMVTKASDFSWCENWDDAPPDQSTIDLCRSVAKHQIIFGGNYFQLPPTSCWLVWDKETTGDYADCELAWTNLKQAVRIKRYRWNGMLQEPGRPKEQRVYPTQKPTHVISWAMSQAPSPIESVIDPFMGSGTTLVAARYLGIKRIVGIDRFEKACEIAVNRLRQTVLPL